MNLPEESIRLWHLKVMNPKNDMKVVLAHVNEIVKDYDTLPGEVKRSIASAIAKIAYHKKNQLEGELREI